MKLWNNTKHPELVEYYHRYEWEKPTYCTYYSRVMVQGMNKEEAMTYKRSWKSEHYDDTGRVCSRCKAYKNRSEYHYSRTWRNHKTTNCIECRTIMKKEYRQKTGYAKDHEYKKKIRTLKIWSLVAMYYPILHEWVLREDSYRVLDYKYKKWYLVKSTLTGKMKYISIMDNKTGVKVYEIREQPIQEKEIKQEEDWSYLHL